MSVRVSYVSSAPPPPHLEVEGIPDRPGNLPWPKSEPQSRPGRIPTTTGCSRLLDVFACFRVDKTLIPGLMTTHVARVKPTREPFATFRFCSLLPLIVPVMPAKRPGSAQVIQKTPFPTLAAATFGRMPCTSGRCDQDSTQVLLATALFYLNDGWEEEPSQREAFLLPDSP